MITALSSKSSPTFRIPVFEHGSEFRTALRLDHNLRRSCRLHLPHGNQRRLHLPHSRLRASVATLMSAGVGSRPSLAPAPPSGRLTHVTTKALNLRASQS